MILQQIAEHTKERVAYDKSMMSMMDIKKQLDLLPKGDFRFEKALISDSVSIIGEVKKASPSKGVISNDFPFINIAVEYEEAAADCISVLTEPKWFLGSDEIFKQIRQKVTLPMIRKDFTIDEYQIYQAKLMGADAVLLICKLLDPATLKSFLELCDDLGLSALVETHNSGEISSALRAEARIIGVNNRNLQDFSVDLSNSIYLRPYIPENILFVAESGVQTPQDAISLARSGANSILIGEALMRCPDKKLFVQQIKAGVAHG